MQVNRARSFYLSIVYEQRLSSYPKLALLERNHIPQLDRLVQYFRACLEHPNYKYCIHWRW